MSGVELLPQPLPCCCPKSLLPSSQALLNVSVGHLAVNGTGGLLAADGRTAVEPGRFESVWPTHLISGRIQCLKGLLRTKWMLAMSDGRGDGRRWRKGRVKVAGSGHRLVMERGCDGAIAGKAGEGDDADRGIVDAASDGRIYRASSSLLATVARHRSSMKKGGAGSAIHRPSGSIHPSNPVSTYITIPILTSGPSRTC
ncbi:hypothetical protein ACLOJK_037179 [Asimina triloba]